MPFRIGVDLGTTFTAAAVSEGAEPTLLGLGDRALQIPSVLLLKHDGQFLVGEAAERRGLAEPERLAREFKRRIGDHVPIMVAGAPFSPQALTAHLLGWVVQIATERMGEPPAEVVLTHPANWGPFRLELLDQAAAMANVASIRRCTEPEAAAAQYAAQTRVNSGDRVAVYDLGGGTFDICILEKTDSGFRILGTPEGVEHLGGVDFDEAVLRHVLATLNTTSSPLDPDDPDVTLGLARLRRDCVEAKEALSRDVDALVPVALPGLNTTVRLTRAEFELMIRPAISETIAATTRALRNAGIEPAQLRSILLVGGSSRIPLVSELLHGELSVPTALDTHPKHDVALGSLRVGHDTDVSATVPTESTRQSAPETQPKTFATEQTPMPAAATEGSLAPQPPATEPSLNAADLAAPIDSDVSRPALLRVMAVVVIAVLIGIGAGVLIALRDRETVANPPTTLAPTPTAISPTAGTPAPTTWPVSQRPLPEYVVVSPKSHDGNWDVEMLDARTGATIGALAKGPEQDTFPVLSPDRRTVAYLRWARGNVYTLRVVSADGLDDKEMLAAPPTGCVSMMRPAWSTSNLLALPCKDAVGMTLLTLIDRQGAPIRQLDRGNLGDPTFTSDGRSVVYWRSDGEADGGALHQVSIDGKSKPINLTDGKDGQDNDPACSPDGSRVAFRRKMAGFYSMAVIRIDAGYPQQPTILTTGNNDQDPSWSPDSDLIVFKRGPDENADLYLIGIGGTPRPLVKDDEPDTTPAWTSR